MDLMKAKLNKRKKDQMKINSKMDSKQNTFSLSMGQIIEVTISKVKELILLKEQRLSISKTTKPLNQKIRTSQMITLPANGLER